MDKALVLLSGGQDSTTCLAWAQNEGFDCEAITFQYGQRHMGEEYYAAKRISRVAGVNLKLQNLLPPTVPSALIGQGDISGRDTINPQLPASFLPGRNFLLLGYAAAYAYGKGIHQIVIGVSQSDYSGYPDCRAESILKIESALCSALEYDLMIRTPLMYLSKRLTVQLMKELGHLDWYKYTHTCYEGKVPPCGKCPACILRAKGFKEANIKDPLMEVYDG